MDSRAARVPVLMITLVPRSRRVVPLGNVISKVLGETRATVHKQGLAGNERHCVDRKKGDRGSDFTRMSDPPHLHPAQMSRLAFAALRIV